ncbi:MAG TPA: GNAT family N-acetyltransferase [Gemmataceae bacterium]|nr:GNAT family N-acetyltransferase [Gemmataceae bacterium]
MSGVPLPPGFRLERLARVHPRKEFRSGVAEVDEWLAKNALQNQVKHLSATRVLLDERDQIAGYYTLASSQADFGDLPPDEAKKLPRRMLPVAVLAWLGVSVEHQGKGLGRLLLAQALRDCYEAGHTFAFIAVVLDCVNDAAKAFHQKFEFRELPGHPYRLFLSAAQLQAMMRD